MTLRKNSRDHRRFESTGDEVVSKSWCDVTKIPRSVVSRLFGWQDPRLLREGAQIGKEPRKKMGMRLQQIYRSLPCFLGTLIIGVVWHVANN